MHEALFRTVGLSEDEAYIYGLLLEKGPQGAGTLLKVAKNIKRGLLYKVLERLVERGLVLERKKEGKLFFVPRPPETLMKFAEEQETVARRSKEGLKAALPELKAKFNLSTERPVIRLFEGIEGLRAIYEDRLESGVKDFYFIRSSRATVYQEAFGVWFTHYLRRQTKLGIKVYALTVDDEHATHDPEVDRLRHVVRTWLRPQDYTAPVEIAAYADCVSIISYGKEIFGLILESAPLAQAFREMLILADKGAKTVKVLHDHPPAKPPNDSDLLKKK